MLKTDRPQAALLLAATTLVVAAAAARPARADLSYTAGAADFPAAPGGTIVVPVYVAESGATQEISSDGGLFSGGFAVQQTAPLTPAAAAVVTHVDRNAAAFDTTNDGSAYSDVSATLWTDQSGGTIANPAMPAGGLLLLGTITVQAPAAPGQVTAYSIGDFDPTSAQLVTYGGTELDALVAGGSFTVTTLPEPASLGLIGLAGAAMTLRRRRRTLA